MDPESCISTIGIDFEIRTTELDDETIKLQIWDPAGLFEIKLIGDEYFTFIAECKDPKACSILLRGSSKDVLNEIERNLGDAMSVARNVMMENTLVPGGGALEMALSTHLTLKAQNIVEVRQNAYLAVANALEVIPRTLAQNCGAKVLRLITELRAKHAMDPANNWSIGVDGEEGVIVDMKINRRMILAALNSDGEMEMTLLNNKILMSYSDLKHTVCLIVQKIR